MDKVKESVAAGVPLSNAVKARLVERGSSLVKFSAKHGVERTAIGSALAGNRAPTERELRALIAEFGGTADEWRALISQAVQRRLAPAVNQ